MKHFRVPNFFPACTIGLLLFTSACSCGPLVDASIINKTARTTIVQEKEKQDAELEALKDSLPAEVVQEVKEHNKKREKDLGELMVASPFKTMDDAGIEAMAERWMSAYEASGSRAYRDLVALLSSDLVLKAWCEGHQDKFKGLLKRFKAVK